MNFTRLSHRRNACRWIWKATPKVIAGWRHTALRMDEAVTGSKVPLTLVCKTGPSLSS